ncbi:MAG: DNA double-strand break repair nuclease NurA [Candidatus Aenigmatarchaeota archaeon]
MPLYKEKVAQDLEEKKSEFSGVRSREVVEEYQEAAGSLEEDYDLEELEEQLEELDSVPASPTEEFDEKGLLIPFEESNDWGSHEAVNNWARQNLESVSTIAADGSQIDPVSEFEQPVGLVQVVWMKNNHSAEKSYDQGVETEVLTPDDLLFENPNTGFIQVDDQEVPVTRFETEMRVLEEQVKQHSEAEEPPVVMYDGSLILSFMQMFDQKTQERYAEALARLLAASKHHGVPVVGYISGSRATELGQLIKKLDLVETQQSVRDYQVFSEKADHWGSRTALFTSHRDSTLNKLTASYHGQDYDFSQDILFTYLNIGAESQMDRVELPRWILEEDMVEYVLSTIRAECGVGRGYCEILQAVDADAVLSRNDREEFLRLYQDFSDEHEMELRWNNKALSKKRRRR